MALRKTHKRQLKALVTVVLVTGVVWTVCALGVRRLGGGSGAAPRFASQLEMLALGELDEEGRGLALKEIARSINEFTFEERAELMQNADVIGWFDQLSAEESAQLIEDTLPETLRKMRERFFRLTPEEREEIIADAVERVQASGERLTTEEKEEFQTLLTSPRGERMMDATLRSYFVDTAYEQRVELSPLVKEIKELLEKANR